MTRAFVAGGLALALAPPRAWAADRTRLTPSLQVSQEYDSDVLRKKGNPQSDLVTRIDPMLRFDRSGEGGHARLDLGMERRFYRQVTEFDSSDWFTAWDVDRQLSPRLSFLTDGRLTRLENQDDVIEGDRIVDEGRVDQLSRRINGGLRYRPGPASSVLVLFGYQDQDYSAGDRGSGRFRRDYQAGFGLLQVSRLLGPRDQLSLSTEAQRARFADIGAGSEIDDLLSASAGWQRAWSPLWSTSVSLGGRLLRTRDSAGTGRTVGFVGGASLTRILRRGEIRLSYRRETRPSSGLGANLDRDLIDLAWKGRLTDRLSFRVAAGLDRYRSASDSTLAEVFVGQCPPSEVVVANGIPICLSQTSQEIDSQSMTASVRLDWRARKHFTPFLLYSFRRQRSSGTLGLSEFDSHRILVGIRLERPIELD